MSERTASEGAAEGPSDETLVRRVREGDEEAFELLVKRYRGEMRGRIERCLPRGLRRKVSVADVLQETCLAAFHGLDRFELREPGSLGRWLRRIAELKAHMAVRRHVGAKKRSVEREVSRWARPATGAFAAVQPSPSEDAVTAERADRAERAMAELREDDRTVLRLAIHEQLTLREVAERMGRSHEAVKKLYGRALARFTKVYRGGEDGS